VIGRLASLSLKSVLFIPVPDLERPAVFVRTYTCRTKSFWGDATTENVIDLWALRADMDDPEPVLGALIKEYNTLKSDGRTSAAEDLRSFIFAHHRRKRSFRNDHPDLLLQLETAFPQYGPFLDKAAYLTRAGRYTTR
jgi:hypothetical protein